VHFWSLEWYPTSRRSIPIASSNVTGTQLKVMLDLLAQESYHIIVVLSPLTFRSYVVSGEEWQLVSAIHEEHDCPILCG
jgi:predicted cupin superfamily sugar epimerase